MYGIYVIAGPVKPQNINHNFYPWSYEVSTILCETGIRDISQLPMAPGICIYVSCYCYVWDNLWPPVRAEVYK